ncbi:MAG: hypothetical protein AAGB51_02940 [Planctomycetota bacterium]
MSHLPIRRGLQVGAAALLLIVSVPASAQQRAQGIKLTGPQISQAVSMLGSDQLRLRLQAERAIAGDSSLKTKDLIELARSDSIGAEQRLRLIDLAREKFEHGPDRAAIGIGFAGDEQGRSIIGTVHDQFPSAAVLRAGDEILRIGNLGLEEDHARDELVAMIVSHDPNAVVPIRIRRGIEELDLTLQLGSFGMFSTGESPQGPTLERAWRLRLARDGLTGAGLLERAPIDARVNQTPVFPPPAPAAPVPERDNEADQDEPTSRLAPVRPGGADGLGPAVHSIDFPLVEYRRRRGESDEAYLDRLRVARQQNTTLMRLLERDQSTVVIQLRDPSAALSPAQRASLQLRYGDVRAKLQDCIAIDEQLNRLSDQIGAGER